LKARRNCCGLIDVLNPEQRARGRPGTLINRFGADKNSAITCPGP